MANRIMEADSRQTTTTKPQEAAVKEKAKRKSVGRTSSGTVRRLIEKRFQSIRHLMNDKDDVQTASQWSQRLQSHLKAKAVQGPSTHETQIRTNASIPDFDGEASHPDLHFTTEPPGNYASASRLETSITADIIAAHWMSPSKNKSSKSNGSYSNLDPPRSSSKSDSKSLMFTDIGNHSGSFNGGNDFLNMSSGPLNTGLLNLSSASKETFTVVRQAAQEPYELPKSRKSLFGGPVLAPKLAKQLTDFRLRRQGKQKDTEEDNDFSVSTEKLKSSHHPEEKPAKSSRNSISSSVQRKLNASGKFQHHVEHLLANQQQRVELNNEIELRRHKFKDKLAALSSSITNHETDDEISMTLDAIQPTGKRPFRSNSSGSATLRRHYLQESLDSLLFDDDDDAFFATASKPKKQDTILEEESNSRLRARSWSNSELEKSSHHMPLQRRQPTANTSFHKKPSRSLKSPPSARTIRSAGSSDKYANSPLFHTDDIDAYFTEATKGKSSKEERTQPEESQSRMRRRWSNSELEKSSHHTPLEKQQPARTANRSFESNRSERTTRSAGSNYNRPDVSVRSGRSDPTASARSERTTGSHESKLQRRRRATLSASSAAELEQSFQLHKDNNFETAFSSQADQDTTHMFHQSFALEALMPKTSKNTKKKQQMGCSMPHINAPIMSNMLLFEKSLSTVAESIESRKSVEKETAKKKTKTKRRNSLPTGSTHDTVPPPPDILFSPQLPKNANSADWKETTNKMTPKVEKKKKQSQTADKGTTSIFHQSFAIEALVTPRVRKKKQLGSSMPAINTPMQSLPTLSLFDQSSSLLSTVDETVVSQNDGKKTRKPKRRNSLPTGSTHGVDTVPKDLLFSPQLLSKPKLTKAKSTDTTTPRQSRRRRTVQEVQTDLEASFAQLCLQEDYLDSAPASAATRSKTSSGSVATFNRSVTTSTTATSSRSRNKMGSSVASSSVHVAPEEEEQIILTLGQLAPPKADSAVPNRRRASVAAPPEHVPDKTVEKIRARRRESTRVSAAAKLRMKDNSESAVSSRRKERKSRREKVSSLDALKRSTTDPNGELTQKGTTDEKMNDDSRKKRSGKIPTPIAARRVRRATLQAEPSTPRTPRSARKSISEGTYKSRQRSPNPQFGISASTPRLRFLNRGMDDGSSKMVGRSNKTMDDGSQIGRSARRNARPKRQISTDESETKSEEMSDDSDYEPTPKPAAPPTLPGLTTRRAAGSSMLSPGSSKPRTPQSARKSISEGTYKSRLCSPNPQFGISSTTPRLRSLNQGMDDGSIKMAGRRNRTIDDGSQIGRSARRHARWRGQTSTDESETKGEEMSDDDSDYEPTPKPAAPPSLPGLSTPRMVGAPMLSPRRSSCKAKPRRNRSGSISKTEKEDYLPDLETPSAERRKTRNRRHTAHEALKGSETSSPAGIVKTSGEAVEADSGALKSPELKAGKTKKAMDKKLMAEISRSPNKASRFRRRKTTASEETQKDETVAKSPGRSSRKSRRSGKNDEAGGANNNSPKPLRRRKTEANVTTPLRGRLRRVKTADSNLPIINLDDDLDNKTPEKKHAADEGKEEPPELDGNASNRLMLRGVTF